MYTRSLMACPPNVLIRWMASWITKTSRMREGMVNMVAEDCVVYYLPGCC